MLFYAVLVLSAMTICLSFALYRVIGINQNLRNALPFLLKGEQPSYFQLLSISDNTDDVSSLGLDPVSVVFIFAQPCSTCDQNLVIWQKFVKLAKEKVRYYGIVPGNVTEAKELVDKTSPLFPVYIPKDLKKFRDAFRMKSNEAETIVLRNNKVDFLKTGTLSADEAIQLIKSLGAPEKK